MSTPIDIATLVNEGTCYTCFAPQPIPGIAELALWSRIAQGGASCGPIDAPVLSSTVAYTSDGNYTLSWSAVPGAVSYWIFVAEDVDFLFQVADSNTAATSQFFADVTGATRFARVYAINACGDISAYSNVITFSTDVPAIAPTTLAFLFSGTLGTADYSTAAYAPTSNALLLACIFYNGTINSVSGNGLTWELVQSTPVNYVVSEIRCYVYRCQGAATPGALTINATGNGAGDSGLVVQVQQFTNVKIGSNGADAIWQSAVAPYNGGVTISALDGNSLNAILGLTVSQQVVTAEAGWATDLVYQTVALRQMNCFISHKVSTTDNSYLPTSVGANLGNLALEIVNFNSGTRAIAAPTTITNLQIWSRSTDGVFTDAGKTVPATNGDPVYTWDNEGNNALVADWIQATVGLRPIYHTGGLNGLPYLQSDGTKKMNLISGSFAQPVSVVVIANWEGALPTDGEYISSENLVMGALATAKPYLYAGLVGQSAFVLDATVRVLVGRYNQPDFNGAGSLMTINNLAQSGTVGSPGGSGIANTMGIFYWILPQNNYFPICKFYECMVFNKALTAADICLINIYARDRYGFVY